MHVNLTNSIKKIINGFHATTYAKLEGKKNIESEDVMRQ